MYDVSYDVNDIVRIVDIYKNNWNIQMFYIIYTFTVYKIFQIQVKLNINKLSIKILHEKKNSKFFLITFWKFTIYV